MGVLDEEEVVLAGGNVGGAVRVGDSVRRTTGPWTPAVHALLAYLHGRVPHIPQVLGFDHLGRESLTYLPGRVVDIDTELLTSGQIQAMGNWARTLHEAVGGFAHRGPWRFFPVVNPSLIGHNDIAPYNVCFDADQLVGVFDWDFAGPTTPLFELAFMAWNCVPLWRDIGAQDAADRLSLLAASYGLLDARPILHAVPERIQLMFDGIPTAAAAGDPGMANLMTAGEPARSHASLQDLIRRIPGIDSRLPNLP